MGRELYATQPSVRRTLDRCAEILAPELDRPLLEVLFPSPGAATPLDETAYTQPALFALEYALAQLWREWGIEPVAVMGHSVGEYVAACVAGVFGLEDGLRLVAARGRLMQALPRDGSMVAALAGLETVRRALAGHEAEVDVAAVNGPQHVVISGTRGGVAAVAAVLAADDVRTVGLRVSHAFHSPLMDPVLAGLERVLRAVPFRPPALPLVTNLTGGVAPAEIVTPAYWVRHAREPVRFLDGMRELAALDVTAFLEIGPAPTLLAMGRRCLPGDETRWLASLRPERPAWHELADSVAALWAAGAPVDWAAFDRDRPRRRRALPTYPFQRRRYWFDDGGSGRAAAPAAGPGRILDTLLRGDWERLGPHLEHVERLTDAEVARFHDELRGAR